MAAFGIVCCTSHPNGVSQTIMCVYLVSSGIQYHDKNHTYIDGSRCKSCNDVITNFQTLLQKLSLNWQKSVLQFLVGQIKLASLPQSLPRKDSQCSPAN